MMDALTPETCVCCVILTPLFFRRTLDSLCSNLRHLWLRSLFKRRKEGKRYRWEGDKGREESGWKQRRERDDSLRNFKRLLF